MRKRRARRLISYSLILNFLIAIFATNPCRHLSTRFRFSYGEDKHRSQSVFHSEKRRWEEDFDRGVTMVESKGKLDLELGTCAWVRDCLSAVARKGTLVGFWRRRRLASATIFFQVLANDRGRFGLLSLEPIKGKKSFVFFPEGDQGDRWASVAAAFTKILPPPVGQSKKGEGDRKKKEVGRKETEVKLVEDKDKSYKQALLDEDISDNSPFDHPSEYVFAFDCSSSFIIERFKRGIGWSWIKENLREKVVVGFALKPFCANLAVGICNNPREAKEIADKGVVGETEGYCVQQWSLKLIAEGRKSSFEGGWVTFMDIPPFLRTKQVITSLADLCEGILEEDDVFGEICWTEEVYIKVAGNDSGFMPSVCYLFHKGVYFTMRLMAGGSTLANADREEGNSKKSVSVRLGLPKAASLAGQRVRIIRDHVKDKGKTASDYIIGPDNSGPKEALKSDKWSSQSGPSNTQGKPKGSTVRIKEKGKEPLNKPPPNRDPVNSSPLICDVEDLSRDETGWVSKIDRNYKEIHLLEMGLDDAIVGGEDVGLDPSIVSYSEKKSFLSSPAEKRLESVSLELFFNKEGKTEGIQDKSSFENGKKPKYERGNLESNVTQGSSDAAYELKTRWVSSLPARMNEVSSPIFTRMQQIGPSSEGPSQSTAKVNSDGMLNQCKNGHISCSSCCTKAHNKCASCGLEIGNMRCRPIEKLLESIKVQCRNSKYGCKRTIYWNKLKDHGSSCGYEPCSCPLSDCSFVGSSGQLSSHFTKKHKSSAQSFSFDSKFTVCFKTGDTYRILQEEKDGCLFLLSYTSEVFGNAATVSRIGCSSSKRKFYYEIKAKAQERILCSQSTAKEIQARVEVPPPSNGSLLIPNGFFESSSEMTLELCIWPAREK